MKPTCRTVSVILTSQHAGFVQSATNGTWLLISLLNRQNVFYKIILGLQYKWTKSVWQISQISWELFNSNIMQEVHSYDWFYPNPSKFSHLEINGIEWMNTMNTQRPDLSYSLTPGRFKSNFQLVIFKLNLVSGGWRIFREIALKWMSLDLIIIIRHWFR